MTNMQNVRLPNVIKCANKGDNGYTLKEHLSICQEIVMVFVADVKYLG